MEKNVTALPPPEESGGPMVISRNLKL